MVTTGHVIQRGDRFVAFPDERPCRRLYIEVTRVAKDRTWADIHLKNWHTEWTKRQRLSARGCPPLSEPYQWTAADLNAQETDHMAMLNGTRP